MRNKHLFPVDIENQAIVPGFFSHILKVYVQYKETEANLQTGSPLGSPPKPRKCFLQSAIRHGKLEVSKGGAYLSGSYYKLSVYIKYDYFKY